MVLLHLPCSFKIFVNVFAFLYVKEHSKEICAGNILSFFFQKMLMSAFLLRFKANYLEKMRGYPNFSLWIPMALAKIYFFPLGPNPAQKPLYLVGTVLNVDYATHKLGNSNVLYNNIRNPVELKCCETSSYYRVSHLMKLKVQKDC